MSSEAPKNAPPLGEPIPLGVVDLARETVGVPDQSPNFRRQIELLRAELGRLETSLFEKRSRHADRGASTGADTRPMLPGFSAVLVLALGLLAAAGLRRRGAPWAMGRG